MLWDSNQNERVTCFLLMTNFVISFCGVCVCVLVGLRKRLLNPDISKNSRCTQREEENKTNKKDFLILSFRFHRTNCDCHNRKYKYLHRTHSLAFISIWIYIYMRLVATICTHCDVFTFIINIHSLSKFLRYGNKTIQWQTQIASTTTISKMVFGSLCCAHSWNEINANERDMVQKKRRMGAIRSHIVRMAVIKVIL